MSALPAAFRSRPTGILRSTTLSCALLSTLACVSPAQAQAMEPTPHRSADPLPVAHIAAPTPWSLRTAHRSYLRSGCTWDIYGRSLQKCRVYSEAMRTVIPVEILPSLTPQNPRVLMALDGYGNNNDHNGFIQNGDLQSHLVGKNITLVAPISGDYAAGTYYADYTGPDKSGRVIAWETFLTRELPAYLARHFQVPPRPRSWALTGLSMGSVGIMNLAQRHPRRYAAVNAMSGYYTLSSPAEAAVLAAGAHISGLTPHPQSMWGVWPGGEWPSHDPARNVHRYTMPVRLSCGNGTALKGSSDDLSHFEKLAEQLSWVQTRRMAAVVSRSAQRDHFTILIGDKGAHNWYFWSRDLYQKGGLAFLLRALHN